RAFRGGEEPGAPGQRVVAAQEFADRAVGGGDPANDGTGVLPGHAPTRGAGRGEDGRQAGFTKPPHLFVRRLACPVPVERVDREVVPEFAGDTLPEVLGRGDGVGRGAAHRRALGSNGTSAV